MSRMLLAVLATLATVPLLAQEPSNLLAAGERVAKRLIEENKRERNYRFDLALEGLLELSETTGKPEYRDHVMKVIADRGWTAKSDVSFREQSFTCLTYALYRTTNDGDWLKVFLVQSDLCRKGQQRSPEGAVMHARGRERGGGYAMLLDSTQEYLARMARAGKHTGEDAYFREVTEQLRLFRKVVRDEKTGLWHQGRGWLGDRPQQISPGAWSRGHGWWLRGLSTAAIAIPRDRPEFKLVQGELKELADTLIARQQPSGLWHCLLDRDPGASPPESSGTAMIATALSRASRAGVLDGNSYRDAARKAFAVLPEYVDGDGLVLSTSPGPGPLESEEKYLVKSFPAGNDHGTFAILFAAAEAARK